MYAFASVSVVVAFCDFMPMVCNFIDARVCFALPTCCMINKILYSELLSINLISSTLVWPSTTIASLFCHLPTVIFAAGESLDHATSAVTRQLHAAYAGHQCRYYLSIQFTRYHAVFS